jgi:IclR family pca regulon transcriptional regulator
MAHETAEPAKHAYHIEALARGLAVLDAFGPQRRELSLRDIAEVAGVTQPSALRIGYTLIEAGYLVRNPSTKGYLLGPGAMRVGLSTLGAMTLPEIAEPYLVELRNRTQESVKLAVPDDTRAVIVARIPSFLHPDSTMYVGMSAPLYLTSLGRAILAWQPAERVQDLVDRAERQVLTPKSLSKEQAFAELDATRRRGYALNDQGTTLDHRSVAAPLRAPGGEVIASLNLSMSVQRISTRDLERKMAPLVVETAEAVSAMIPPNVQGAGRIGQPAAAVSPR